MNSMIVEMIKRIWLARVEMIKRAWLARVEIAMRCWSGWRGLGQEGRASQLSGKIVQK